MGRKNQILLHVGPNPADTDHADLEQERELFAGVDHEVAAVDQARLDRATLEMLWQHRSAGLRRRDVEGTWAGICRALLKARTDLVLSLPGLSVADDVQSALVVEALAGLDVHVLLTPDDDTDPGDLVARWSRHVKRRRVHVAPLREDATTVDLAEELAGTALCTRRADPAVVGLRKHRSSIRNRIGLRVAS